MQLLTVSQTKPGLGIDFKYKCLFEEVGVLAEGLSLSVHFRFGGEILGDCIFLKL